MLCLLGWKVVYEAKTPNLSSKSGMEISLIMIALCWKSHTCNRFFLSGKNQSNIKYSQIKFLRKTLTRKESKVYESKIFKFLLQRQTLINAVFHATLWDKGAINKHWRKDSLFNNWCWENWKSICSKMKLDPYPSPCRKLKVDHGPTH